MKIKKRLETIPCKRCDRPVVSLIKPLGVGPHSQYMYENYKGICFKCLTDLEKADLREKGVLL